MLGTALGFASLLAAAGGCRAPQSPGPAPAEPGYRLVRCGYRVGDHFQYIDVDRPLSDVPLAFVIPGMKVRGSYEVYARKQAKTIVCEDYGDAWDYRVYPRDLEPFPSVDQARAAALEALRMSMRPPRQVLEWHYIALAGFLGLEFTPLSAAEQAALIDHLARAPDPELLAKVLFPRAHGFSEAQLAPLLDHERLAPRLLALVRRAWSGDRGALKEILTLSLEYQGELPLFEAAVSAAPHIRKQKTPPSSSSQLKSA